MCDNFPGTYKDGNKGHVQCVCQVQCRQVQSACKIENQCRSASLAPMYTSYGTVLLRVLESCNLLSLHTTTCI